MIFGAIGGAMVIKKTFASLPAVFSARTLKLNAPATVGVPEIAPVPLFKLKPGGRLPLFIDHVIGVVPLAVSVSLYGVHTVPPCCIKV